MCYVRQEGSAFTAGLLTHLMLHCNCCLYTLQEPSTVEAFVLLEGLQLYSFHHSQSMPDQSLRFWLCHCYWVANSDKLNHGGVLCRKSSTPKEGRGAGTTTANATNILLNKRSDMLRLTIPLDTWRANLSSWLGFKTILWSWGGSGEPPLEKLWWRNCT